MRTTIMIGLLMGLASSPLAAQNSIELSRAVFVERLSEDNLSKVIEPASQLQRGETVLLVVEWQNPPSGGSFEVSSQIPAELQYRGSSDDRQVVSIDGGRSWGRIGALRISDAYGQRFATVEDVTHLRWLISSRNAAYGRGQITYSAIVR